MPSEFIETKDGVKVRKLTELRTSTAQEYQDAMMSRVEEFKNRSSGSNTFENTLQNTLVKGLSMILNLKVKVDNAIGEENLEKVHDFIDNLLLFGL